jgi:hypothetical protein
VRKIFDDRIAEFRTKLESHKAKVQTELEKHLGDSRKKVVDYYLPLVKARPPDSLIGQLPTEKPDDEHVRCWLDMELDHAFPRGEQLLSEMKLDVQYRDVTYETLKENGFAEALRQAYPQVNWNKPFDEFNAAREKQA